MSVLPIFTNAVWQARITLRDPIADAPYNLTGKTLKMQFKTVPGTPVLVEASTTNGKLVIVSAPNGTIDLKLAATDTALMPPGNVTFDLIWTNFTDGPARLFGGRILVRQGVTA